VSSELPGALKEVVHYCCCCHLFFFFLLFFFFFSFLVLFFLLLQTKEHKEYLDQQFALLGPEAIAYSNMSEFNWAFASVASRAFALPATSKLPTFYTQKVVSATKENLAAAEEAHAKSVKEGVEGKQGKGLSWEDEFLFDEEEVEKLKEVGKEGEKGRRGVGGCCLFLCFCPGGSVRLQRRGQRTLRGTVLFPTQ